MRQAITAIGISFLLLPLAIHQEEAPVTPDNNLHFNIPSPVPLAYSTTSNSGAAPVDTASLKQGSWYNNAVKNIEESEYQFNWNEESNAYCTPNRHQNLRFFYTEDGFTVEPRTTKIPVGEYDPMKDPDEIKYKELPDWKVQFDLDKAQTGNGNWQLNGNTAEYITPAVTVQYINNKEGMRQNFIVQQPLQQQGKLRVNLAIKTDLKIKAQQTQLQFFHKKNNVLNYSDLKVWDACGNSLAASFKETTKGNYAIEVDDEGATYPVTIDPVSTTPATILESNQAGAYFGASVSSAGDVNGDGYGDVIVGAIYFENGQSAEGAAFIYHGSATGINVSPARILEANLINASFGNSVSSAGDVNSDGYSDVIVGAWGYTNGQINEGAVYVYHGSATGIPSSPAAILESNLPNALMGTSVASAGDVNGDGYSDVIVGAYHFSNGQSFEGAVYIYHGSPAGINLTYARRLESNQASAEFGRSVSSAGDVNGDGYSDVIAGANQYNNGESLEGAAFVYHGSATGIGTTAAIMLESNQVNAQLGASVSGAGDVNGDGYSDLIVGVHRYDNGQTDEGAAFVFHGSAAGVPAAPATILEFNQAGAGMGYSVACAGDVNGDGYSDVFVAIPLYDNGETDEGGAIIYSGSATGINTTATAIMESNQSNSFYGIHLKSTGDVNGDGYSDVIVGAYTYNNGQVNEGAAFIYHGSATGINTTSALILESNQDGARFGISVAAAGDVNADGYSDVIIGANQYDNGQVDEGAAFIYYGSATGINPGSNTRLEGNQDNAEFGVSVSGAGDVNGDGYSDVIVGAWHYDNGEADEGAFYIYYGSAAGISTVPAATRESNNVFSQMGCSVAGAGDVNGDGYGDVIVGADYYTNGQNGEGAFYIYHGSTTGISTNPATLTESNQANAEFGLSVAGAGDVNGDGFSDVIVGSPFYNNGQPAEGAALIYHGSPSGINTVAQAIVSSNQFAAQFGYSVAGAGDVNGDGFGDVIVGAREYNNSLSGNGAAFVYNGAASGINTTASTVIETNQLTSRLGTSVAGCGDLNGDGYSDVIVGDPNYTPVSNTEGGAFILQGSATGIATSSVVKVRSYQSGASMGFAVAGAGDINGDGYSDIIVGAANYDNGENNEGTVFIYHGNNPGNGKRNNLRLYNADLVTPIQQSNFADPNLFGAGLFVKSPLGRQKGRLVWETVANGNPFSGTPITNSVASTAQNPVLTDLGLNGIELKHQIAKAIPAKATYIRARVKYDPVTSITGQVYGPWRYPEGFLRGRRDIGAVALPVKFIAFTVTKQNEQALLKWITVDETPGIRYEVQHSTNGTHFTTLAILPAYNGTRNEYEWLHTNPSKGINHYRIRAVENDKEAFTATRQLIFSNEQLFTIYPNPVKSGATLTIASSTNFLPGKVFIQLVDMSGREVAQHTFISPGTMISLPLRGIPAGQYTLRIKKENNETYAAKLMVIK